MIYLAASAGFLAGCALGSVAWYWIERAWQAAEDWESEQ